MSNHRKGPQEMAEDTKSRTERVRVPVGLVEELMTWCNDELERAAQGTQFRADLIYFHDELLTAKDGY